MPSNLGKEFLENSGFSTKTRQNGSGPVFSAEQTFSLRPSRRPLKMKKVCTQVHKLRTFGWRGGLLNYLTIFDIFGHFFTEFDPWCVPPQAMVRPGEKGELGPSEGIPPTRQKRQKVVSDPQNRAQDLQKTGSRRLKKVRFSWFSGFFVFLVKNGCFLNVLFCQAPNGQRKSQNDRFSDLVKFHAKFMKNSGFLLFFSPNHPPSLSKKQWFLVWNNFLQKKWFFRKKSFFEFWS